jgi:hypothetical protein
MVTTCTIVEPPASVAAAVGAVVGDGVDEVYAEDEVYPELKERRAGALLISPVKYWN